MAFPSVDSIIDDILEREGGEYTNRPADRGGPTKWGVTLATLRVYRNNPNLTTDDVEALTREEAAKVYFAIFVNEPQFYRIKDPYVLSLAVDSGVQHSPARAIRWIQQAVGVPDDGIFGNQTEVAVNSYDATKLYYSILRKRLEFYGGMISHDPKLVDVKNAGIRLQAENALGWMRRVGQFLEVA